MKKVSKLKLVEGLVIKIQKNEANKLRGGNAAEASSINTKFTRITDCCVKKDLEL